MKDDATYYVGRWHSDHGCLMAVVKRGRTNVYICVQDFPVRVVVAPKSEERHITHVDYPVQRAVRKMLAFGKCGNATKAAIAHLKGAHQ